MSLKKQFEDNLKVAKSAYEKFDKNITHAAVEVAEKLGIEYTDTVRRAFSAFITTDLDPTRYAKDTDNPRVLVYDIESSLCEFTAFWTGKQYVGYKQLRNEPRIITVAWKWLGEDKIYELEWDENKSDKELMEKFASVYNSADMVIGFNNKNFDDRFVNARALKHNIDINTYVRSFDIMKQAKKLFRLPSYAMNYIAKYVGVTTKYAHSGIEMWETIQYGEKEEAKEAMKEMVVYNRQDIVVTEEVYLRLRKYMGHVTHFGMLKGNEKWTCPNCGGENVELYKTAFTPAGTPQRIMVCKDDGVQYKLSNRNYMAFLENQLKSAQ
jgi:DNA polymerase elongation subunit (family B)